MKRQFKPNNRVKHFENKAKRYLAIGKWHEQMHRNAREHAVMLQERLDNKTNDHTALYSQFMGLRNEYFEQNDELRNAKQEILHYQQRIEEQMIRFNKNENALIIELSEQDKLISELRSERNHSLMVLAGVIATFTFVAFW
ncbi:hypothetical protein [Bacillus sp. AFS017336]|uniref:hypothetical protein n=1 Tax=Bacillus sp. AFS017336 TaxID=2033489 RepID=UPI000BF0BC5F|nr:hypothetical protein [Bacillus sp. AFS017336]PEL12683.1 hypothetical protein CN601_06975 [Bacillus sp. AFS017336]